MNRPRIDRENVRTASLVIPMTEAEKNAVKVGADRLGITLASFARMIIREHLGKK